MKTPVLTDIKGRFTFRNGMYVPYFGLGTYQSNILQ
ncbi:MAG: hypothetical protein ACJAU2_000205 [Maribacter sp.]|jgi:hypothetical protein